MHLRLAPSITGLAAILVFLAACAPAAAPSPTAAPAKPAAQPTAAPAKPAPTTAPAAKPAPTTAPAAKPAAKASWKPERPVELVVQASAGGGSDILARTVADLLTKEGIVEQPINVVNKPGGSGAVAYSYLNEKKGEPHFLATVTASYLTTPIQGKSPVSYKNFTNHAVVAVDDFMLVTRADAPWKNLKDLVEAAKAKPNGVRYGGTQVGSSDSIIHYFLEKQAGIELNYVAFNSGGEVNAALLGGSVDLAPPNPGESAELIKAGRLRALAVFAPERLEPYKDVATAKEQGYNVFVEQFRGIVGAGGLKPEEAAFWQQALAKMTATAGWKAYLEKNTLRPLVLTGDKAEEYVAKENERLTEVLSALGLAKTS